MNEQLFYASVRKDFFKGKISTGAFDTLKTILEECRSRKVYDYRHIAYILATAYHESYHSRLNPDWNPVREGFASTNQGAIEAVTALYKAGKIKKNYALPNKKSISHYGRGWVQITLEDNYRRVGDYYGIDLADNPDLALQRPIAALLLVGGMMEGWYTGKKLSDYITPLNTDFISSRRVVNGKDRASLIAGYALKFYNTMIQL